MIYLLENYYLEIFFIYKVGKIKIFKVYIGIRKVNWFVFLD